MREIKIVDQTFRDAPQSLWAHRMTTAMMLPVAERMDRVGFRAIDLVGAGHCDVGVRYLKENPWEKIRLLRQHVTRTPMIFAIRSRGGIGFGVVPNDIALLWIERFVANGMRIFRVFDPLLDLDNNIYQLKYAKELGAYTVGVLAYGHSPVHTDELYVKKAKELIKRANVDAINAAGGTAEFISLADPAFGDRFKGVTHMMMDDTAALPVMDVILGWARQHIANPPSTGQCNSPKL